jgi:SAM-dependent methyltransferase
MEIVKADVYGFPRYYDLVYGSDWRAEYRFLCAAFDKYARGRVQRVFEPACGTGRLLYRLGKAGYQVSGLDLNEKAVDFCNRRLVRHGLPASVWVGDMVNFRVARRVDVAFNMINSFRHLTAGASAQKHLACVANALRPGGLYVLGLHLTPTRGKPITEECWSARRGHLAVNTRMYLVHRDRPRRQERYRIHYDVYTPTRQMRLIDEVVFRTYTWPQFRQLLKKVPDLEVAAMHDFTYDIDVPVEIDARSEDVVFVLRKRAG